MNKQQRAADALERANGLISTLVIALDYVQRAETLEHAKGAAQHAIAIADSRRELDSDGYLAIR